VTAGRLNQLAGRSRELLKGFTPGQRGVILVAVLALALGTVALGRWAAQPSWTTLFTGLSAADTSAIVDQLKNQNVPYQLTNGGNTILVPQQQVYELRNSLTAKGLTTASDGSGWSIIDKQGMTTTTFQQDIAYQRALETELDKTLQAIGGVKTAIVHLGLPKKDVFTSDAERPTASVLLQLDAGATLGRQQIRAVMRLVAGGVPGLKPSDVTVTDGNGNLLSVPEDGQAGAAAAASDSDQQTQAFEDAKSAAVQKLLDGFLGPGKAVVRVNAELNYDSVDTVAESYLPQTSISPLVEATSSESLGMYNGGVGGALGQAFPSLTPGVAAGGSGTYLKVQGTRNNAVGKATSHTVGAPGSIKRLTVAVALDSTSVTSAQADQVQGLVENAVGAVTGQPRNDKVQVTPMAFDTTASAAAAKELKDAQAAQRTAQYLDLGKKAGLALLAVIVAVVMMRRSKRRNPPAQIDAVATDLPAGAGGPAGPAMLPGLLDEQLAIGAAGREVLAEKEDVLDPSLERDLLRDEVSKFVEQQPEEIALIVQGWLGQRKS
jgi:flagellar M-ring protein FliF